MITGSRDLKDELIQTPDKEQNIVDDAKSNDRKSSIKSTKKINDDVSQVSNTSSP
ncbi:MAG: hypothetical protein ACK521_06145 [bacterium]